MSAPVTVPTEVADALIDAIDAHRDAAEVAPRSPALVRDYGVARTGLIEAIRAALADAHAAGRAEGLAEADQQLSDYELGFVRGGIEARRPSPSHVKWIECPDCDGAGSWWAVRGSAVLPDTKVSCETCGGNEDQPGYGYVELVDQDAAPEGDAE